ncbi:iron complex transport system substrate-binding protein [Paenibacillus sp. PastF-3]|uniref:ABC transporter substrate-binding protein n=1 Tax=Paenibacillus sp. PastF-3 TaxID=2940626 RepID=UPI0024737FA3|nr:ABC transporter substrate-binding protein [Paenibacillus sp. PastF-3]MDH6369314.1 iron complex transport system substrate-binding protein [Paenibacillus sp. PastF-3]
MMSKRIFTLIGITLLVFVLAACSKSANKPEEASTDQKVSNNQTNVSDDKETRVVSDIFGDVTIPANPKNILVTSSSYAEDLIEMGIIPQASVVVPEIEPDYRTPYLEQHGVELISQTQYEYNLEQLLSLSPDMIITPGEGLDTKVYDELSKIAPTVALKAGVGVHDAVKELAVLFNKETEADKLLTALDQKASEAKDKIHQAIGDKTVLVLRVEPSRYRYLGPKADDDVSEFFYKTLGLNSPEVTKDSDVWFTQFSLEILPDIKPDYIFLETRSMVDLDSSESLAELEKNPLWKSLKAVKNNDVFPIRTNDYIQAKGPIGTSKLIDYIVEKLVP